MMRYNIEFYPYLPKIYYIFFFISISGRIRIFFQLRKIRIRGKKFRILIPGSSLHVTNLYNQPVFFMCSVSSYYLKCIGFMTFAPISIFIFYYLILEMPAKVVNPVMEEFLAAIHAIQAEFTY